VIADNAVIGNRLWGCYAHEAEINLGPTDDAVWFSGGLALLAMLAMTAMTALLTLFPL
jgi:hypothetical protein